MKRCRLCYGANYSNCEDDFSCIVREFSKIIFLFFGFYKAHVSNLPNAAFVVKNNRLGGICAVPFLPGLAAQQMGSGQAKSLELLHAVRSNTLIRALSRTFQGQKGHYSNFYWQESIYLTQRRRERREQKNIDRIYRIHKIITEMILELLFWYLQLQ